MFTGIVEATGKITSIESQGSNKSFWIQSPLSLHFKMDESICHNGICLTVEDVNKDSHKITAVKETIDKTNIGDWKLFDVVNLERSMLMNGRIDGHIVQGHIDGTAECIERKEKNGSSEFTFSVKKKFAPLIIEKGSVCINGVSLTTFNVGKRTFTVTIIPYTFTHTNFPGIQKGSKVNIEFDLLGKYMQRIITLMH